MFLENKKIDVPYLTGYPNYDIPVFKTRFMLKANKIHIKIRHETNLLKKEFSQIAKLFFNFYYYKYLEVIIHNGIGFSSCSRNRKSSKSARLKTQRSPSTGIS